MRHLAKIMFVLSLMVILLPALASPAAAESVGQATPSVDCTTLREAAGKLNRLTNCTYGYSFTFTQAEWSPWVSIHNGDDQPTYVTRQMISLQPSGGRVVPSLHIAVSANPQQLSSEQWLEAYTGNLQFRDQSVLEHVVDGQPSLSLYAAEANGFASWTTVFNYDGYLYQVRYDGHLSDPESSIYDTVLNSWQFLTPTADLELALTLPTTMPHPVLPNVADCCGLHDSGVNPYACPSGGNCTWYGQYAWNNMISHPNYGGLYPAVSGNAMEWYWQARNGGYNVGVVPSSNALFVLQPGVQGAGSVGHDGYVSGVNGNTFSAQHSNWTWNGVHYCVYNSSFTGTPGADPSSRYPDVGFIYGNGGGSSTPTPTVPTPTPIPALTNTPIPIPTSTATPIIIPTSTATPIIIPTSTPIPAPTNTPIIIPTSTPILPGLAAPILTSPANLATVTSVPTLCWSQVAGASDYIAYVYTGDGTPVTYNSGLQTANCWTPNQITGRYAIWTWWVYAHSTAGTSPQSAVYYFTYNNGSATTPTPPIATPTPATTGTPTGFSDVPASYIFYDDIMFLVGRGAINGYANNTFRPNNPTTRGQFAKIASLAFALPSYSPPNASFSDVPNSSIFFSFIESAAHSGAVSGLSRSQCQELGSTYPCFGPNRNVSRAEIAIIIQRIRSYSPASPAVPSFTDVPVSHFAFSAIETLYGRGIISGATCNGSSSLCFRPNESSRRGELSKLVHRTLSN